MKETLPACEECERLSWSQNDQPRYGIEGRCLCWTHAQLAIEELLITAAEHARKESVEGIERVKSL
jgi:hypothetical protein